MSETESPLERFKRLLGQTAKAIAADPEAEIKFGGEQPKVTGNEARIPVPPRRLDVAKRAIARGHSDAAALKLAHHDELLHAKLTPQNAQGAAVYSALEEMRIEAIGTRHLDGVGDNLEAALTKRLEDKGYQRLEDRQDIPLTEIMALLARERMTGREVPEPARKLVDLWRKDIEDKAGDALDELAKLGDLGDQAAFSDLILDLLADLDIADEKGNEEAEDQNADDESQAEEDDAPDDPGKDENDGKDDAPEDDQEEDSVPELGEAREGEAEIRDEPAEWDESDEEADARARAEMAQRQNLPDDMGLNYHPYTTQFDETVHPDELCDPEELTRLRLQLDNQLEGLHAVVARLANRLQRRLLAQQNRAWQFDLDEGILDAARLARVVVDPTQPLSYKQEKDQPFKDTSVTLLIDNSGSMRGRPITVAALCGDILARTLERCGVSVEILGFTTRAWKGGQSREKWVMDGRPKNPGRLNDLRHIIYKPASVPWRRAKDNLALMLKEGLLKENIDGEALKWAHDRLLSRPEARRILMVISDGAPVDDTTSSANGAGYLDRHLRDVISYIENMSPVELLAIGIGHDVTRFYRRALTIADVEQLGGAMTDQLAALFDDDVPPAVMRRRA
ncbi:cobaltochelatase subunit CobT [Parvularcula marina]|uniref:Cobaltochelatase subunit CobT n=1 Tax=Parvularcula marina TaxID=2292771 RepID=A0A371RFK7_9PROT|nr:cobaltochelatase subunit CobT [Parvularcula marina]RFB04236.1 cobaltochelatase subunit CobT [Parvularcula marina]